MPTSSSAARTANRGCTRNRRRPRLRIVSKAQGRQGDKENGRRRCGNTFPSARPHRLYPGGAMILHYASGFAPGRKQLALSFSEIQSERPARSRSARTKRSPHLRRDSNRNAHRHLLNRSRAIRFVESCTVDAAPSFPCRPSMPDTTSRVRVRTFNTPAAVEREGAFRPKR